MDIELIAAASAVGGFVIAFLVRVGGVGAYVARLEAAERRGAERDQAIENIKRELSRLGQRIAHLEGIHERRTSFEDMQG